MAIKINLFNRTFIIGRSWKRHGTPRVGEVRYAPANEPSDPRPPEPNMLNASHDDVYLSRSVRMWQIPTASTFRTGKGTDGYFRGPYTVSIPIGTAALPDCTCSKYYFRKRASNQAHRRDPFGGHPDPRMCEHIVKAYLMMTGKS